MYDWDLNKIYNGIESEEFKNDLKKIDTLIEELDKYEFNKPNDIALARGFFVKEQELFKVIGGIGNYLGLRLSVNTEDLDALKAMGALDNVYTKVSPVEVKYTKYIKNFENFEELAKSDEEFKKYPYYVSKLVDEAKRSLSDETEILLSKLNRSSSSAWERLFDILTSTLEVDYNGEVISLPEVRNLAYSPEESVRKAAYEAVWRYCFYNERY